MIDENNDEILIRIKGLRKKKLKTKQKEKKKRK